MANTPIEVRLPTGMLNMKAKLAARGSDTFLETIDLEESDNRKGIYTGTVTYPANGWFTISMFQDTTPLGWTYDLPTLEDTEEIQFAHDSGDQTIISRSSQASVDALQESVDSISVPEQPVYLPPAIVPSTDTPLYDRGDIVYLRESAALGFLEAVQISGVMRGPNGWLYAIVAKAGQPMAPSHFGDRITAVQGMILYFSEDEFVTVCDAQLLVEANLQTQLSRIQAQRAALCSVADVTG